MLMLIKFGPKIAVLTFLLGFLGYVWMLRSDNAILRAEAVIADVQLKSCAAKALNMSEDRTSDDEVDNATTTTDDLRDAASEWLLRGTD